MYLNIFFKSDAHIALLKMKQFNTTGLILKMEKNEKGLMLEWKNKNTDPPQKPLVGCTYTKRSAHSALAQILDLSRFSGEHQQQ